MLLGAWRWCCWLLVVGCWLLVAGCWCCWLLVAGVAGGAGGVRGAGGVLGAGGDGGVGVARVVILPVIPPRRASEVSRSPHVDAPRQSAGRPAGGRRAPDDPRIRPDCVARAPWPGRAIPRWASPACAAASGTRGIAHRCDNRRDAA